MAQSSPLVTPSSMTGPVGLLGGTGNLGEPLAARLASTGHAVLIGSRDAARARAAAETVRTRQPGADVRGDVNEVVAAAAAVVFVTVPFDAQAATVSGLAAKLAGKIVVSTAVPVMFDGDGPRHVDVAGGSAAEQLAALLAGARVVGALHTVSGPALGRDRPLDADTIIVGDDTEAKAVVAALIASAIPGLRPVDGGPLRNARHVEQLTVVLLTINRRTRRSTGIRVTNLPDDRALASPPPPG